MATVFSRIYRSNGWNGTESLSGPGSGLEPTRHVASWLLGLVDELGVSSVLDIGCGDSLWLPELPGYLGVDVAPEAVARARGFHPDRRYLVCDARRGLPKGRWDMVLARDVLQHLSFADGFALLRAIGRADPRLMVLSTYTAPSERHHDPVNRDIRTGECYCPDLTSPPFRLPQPNARIQDGWDYADGSVLRDRAKWLGLWRLR